MMLYAIQANAGEVEQFNWRDFQPWRDVSVDPQNPPRQLLGEDLEEGWTEMREHYVDELVASIPETRDPRGELVPNVDGAHCGIDPYMEIDYEDDIVGENEVALQQQRQVAGPDGPSM